MEPLSEALKRSPKLRMLKQNAYEKQEERKPDWLRNSLPAHYPDECRAKCLDCRGWKTTHASEACECQSCMAHDEPCDVHMCRMCGGSGLVCPGCRGMRRVRNGRGGEMSCNTCREGNNINDAREAQAIRQYLAAGKWQVYSPEGLRALRAQRERERKEAADAYHAEWVRTTGTLYGMQRKQDRWEERSKAIEAKYGPPVPIDELLKIPPEPGKKRPRRQE